MSPRKPPPHTPARKPARKNPLAATFEQALGEHRQGRLDTAARLYETVLAQQPADFAALYNLGLVRVDQGRVEDGAALFRRALAATPSSADAHNALGTALQRLERPEDAIGEYRAALAINPRDANALANLGAALATLDREEDARAAYEQALAIAPRHTGALANLGNVLKALGRVDEARETYERALAIAPRNAQLYFALSDTRRFAPGDPYLAQMEKLAAGGATMTPMERIHLNFALGKAYADCGDADRAFDRAFDHLSEGNRLKRASLAYDEAATLDWLARIRAVFTPALLQARNQLGDPSPSPVFVVGMPRSGTTLIEQILASHPAVFGAGEIEIFATAVNRLADARGAVDHGGVRYPELAAALDGTALTRLGADYVAATRALAPPTTGFASGAASNPGPARITDKLPLNFAYVGLIHLALPNARIIHVHRDPVDTCWSCFSKLFTRDRSAAGGVNPIASQFTYDLDELGRFYAAYARTMAHWRSVLPELVLLEVRYEDVVSDLATQARRLVAHCGLPWDDACLAFHMTDRAVRTASAVQVRRPLYAEAIGRSRPYRARLASLVDLVAPHAPAPPTRPALAALACKCCGERALWFGTADFAKSCEDRHGQVFPRAGQPVAYYRCEACGFAFTDFFDDWPPARLRAEIYNAEYVRVDPDFTGARSAIIADVVEKVCGAVREQIRIFDYGGGTGGLVARLRTRGFRHVDGGDPFFDGGPALPSGGIDLVLSVEVLEHLSEPARVFTDAARILEPAGALFVTTVVQPTNIAELRTDWWYCAPRNGHASLHSGASLRMLAAQSGFQFGSFNETMHFAWRGPPAFAAGFIPRLHVL